MMITQPSHPASGPAMADNEHQALEMLASQPFDAALLRARLNASLADKRLRDIEFERLNLRCEFLTLQWDRHFSPHFGITK
jgi:hypothetical protein